MRTVRKLVAALACTALLSVVGAAAAGAQGPGSCNRLARITERIEAKKARIAARNAARPRAANAGQKHQPDLEIKLQDKVAQIQARCSG
jgi:hypothetical protein